MKIDYAELEFTEEGTPKSVQYNDVYYNTEGGLAESEYVFLQGNNLIARWQQTSESHFTIAETGFGTGLNFFASLVAFQQFRQANPQATLKRLFFLSFEAHPIKPTDLEIIYQQYPQFKLVLTNFIQQWHEPIKGCLRMHFAEVTLDLWLGDINDSFMQLGDYHQNKIDAWFLDGFNPTINSGMWHLNLYQQIFQLSKVQATFATFTAASQERKDLQQAGFLVEKRKGYGQKREMLVGKKEKFFEPTIKDPYYFIESTDQQQQIDIAIIGGGVASVFTAIALLTRGAKVTLYCDKDELATNASSNLQGALYPQLSDDDLNIAKFYALAFYYAKNKLQQLGQQLEFKQGWDGVILCAYNQQTQEKFTKISAQNWSKELWQTLTSQELSNIAGVEINYDGALIEKAGWLAPQQLVRLAFKYAETLGLTIVLGQEIQAIEQQDQNWQLYVTEGLIAEHAIVILANGHKLTQFSQTEMLSLSPVRGQVSQIKTSATLSKLKTVLCYDGYLTPVDKTSASHCLGASHIRNNTTRDFNQQEQQQNQMKIQQNLSKNPWVVDIDTSDNWARTGVRLMSRDRIPMLGNVADYTQQLNDYANLYTLKRVGKPIVTAKNHPNLYLIGALASRGLTSAPLLAETLASIIYAEPLPLPSEILQLLSPNRTWIRRLLKGYSLKDL